jgi:hypothetical protein
MSKRRIVWFLAAGAAIALVALGVARIAAGGHISSVRLWHPNKHAVDAPIAKDKREAGAKIKGGPAQEQYDNRALPKKYIALAQTQNSIKVFSAESVKFVKLHPPAWQELGPVSPVVPGSATYTGRSTKVSGRVTALAISPVCFPGNCALYVGAAGGGVWKTNDALASVPVWAPKTDKMPTDAIGSLAVDPNHPNIVYAGTGEENGSGDSEAGLGLYKSTNGGDTWGLLPSSVPIAANSSIGALAIDPANTSHLLMGTDVARHGSSSVNGGRFTPPDAPLPALYESFDAGTTWTKVLQLPASPTPPGAGTGTNWFQGGVTKVAFDQTGHGNEYASIFGYGLWRNKGSGWLQIFHPLDPNDIFGERTEFALSKWNNGATRVYVGTGGETPAEFYRVNDDRNPASALLASQDNPQGGDQSWKKLSNPNYGAGGYTSYNFCQGQCFYDMGVATPQSGLPSNLVVLSGSMRYGDIFGYAPPVSNGATVIRSTNSGDFFTDMTNDTLDPPTGLHPDSREVAFDPNNPSIMFLPSDGGVVRVGPTYVDASSDCDSRGLTDSQKKTCKFYLRAIPDKINTLNEGLRTLQFQSVTINKQNTNDLIGGTQDNGTWAFDCTNGPPCNTFESINGDGGQSAIDSTKPSTRTHSYYLPQYDTNFHGNYPLGWDWISDPLIIAYLNGEQFSFYPPLIQDPVKHGYEFTGGQYVWRTQDNGGPQAYLDQHCNEYFGDFTVLCGDWVRINSDLTVGPADQFSKGGSYVVATERAPSDTQTMWVGTRRGRIFVTKNALDAPSAVKFDRIDTPDQPFRFPSGIAIDPYDPNHAFISFSGYAAYTPGQPGHVFEVWYHPLTHNATWKNLTYDFGDQPATDVELIQATGDLYVSTDFGVLELPFGQQHWFNSGTNLPTAPVYGLRQIPNSGWLFASTHGRGVYRLPVPRIP